eukprot:scaffold6937_cov110-Isochrysis_galbana.AAC.6
MYRPGGARDEADARARLPRRRASVGGEAVGRSRARHRPDSEWTTALGSTALRLVAGRRQTGHSCRRTAPPNGSLGAEWAMTTGRQARCVRDSAEGERLRLGRDAQ